MVVNTSIFEGIRKHKRHNSLTVYLSARSIAFPPIQRFMSSCVSALGARKCRRIFCQISAISKNVTVTISAKKRLATAGNRPIPPPIRVDVFG